MNRPMPDDLTPERPKIHCGGAGEIEVGTGRDSFGNWDTEWKLCPGCPDCKAAVRNECAHVANREWLDAVNL